MSSILHFIFVFFIFVIWPSYAAYASTKDQLNLIPLAIEEFGTISTAERKLLISLQKDHLANYIPNTSGLKEEEKKRVEDPAYAKNWNEYRVLKADFLKWLCTDPEALALVKPGVFIKGARIDGKVDLSFRKMPFILHFRQCSIPQGIDLKFAELEMLNIFSSNVGKIDASGVVIKKDVRFREKSIFNGGVHFDGAQIGIDMSFSGSHFINSQPLDYNYLLTENKILALSLEGARIGGSLFLRNGFISEGEVNLNGTIIEGSLSCTNCKFINPGKISLSANGLSVSGYVNLRDNFRSEGCVSFMGAKVVNNFDCSDGHFINSEAIELYQNRAKTSEDLVERATGLQSKKTRAIDLDSISVGGTVFLNRGFKSKGNVYLLGANIGNLNCNNAQFVNHLGTALYADRITIRNSAILSYGFKAIGEVSFKDANVAGDIDCRKGSFKNPEHYAINTQGAIVKGNFFAKGAKIEGNLSIMNSNIARIFQWFNVGLIGSSFLDFRHSNVGTLMDLPASWPRNGNLFLDGFVYDRIDNGSPHDAKSRKNWLDLQKTDRFIAQPYEQLAKVLHNMGYENDSKAILVEKNRKREQYMSFWSKIVSKIYNLFFGYGYYPFRSLKLMAFFILLSWFIYKKAFHAGVIVTSNENGQKKRRQGDLPHFSPLIYSLDTFIPLIDLYEAKHWLPDINLKGQILLFNKTFPINGRSIRIYRCIITIIGWILSTLFVLSLSGVIRQ